MYQIKQKHLEEKAQDFDEGLPPSFSKLVPLIIRSFATLPGENPKVEAIVLFKNVIKPLLNEIYENPDKRDAFKLALRKVLGDSLKGLV